MPYTALYRKWRPQTFSEVKGQDAIVRTLKNQIRTGRIGHAYLFCGTRGTGKTSIAKIFARAVNCEHPVDGEPCGECAVCRAVQAGRALSVSEIDAASNNGVDDVREIRNQVQYPPETGRYRVFIIDEVHMLSAGAFNALLKTLEEPPEYVIFILATTEANRIPVTVLSRCQRYDFRRITADTITGRLRQLADAESMDVEDEALRYIARVADGSMRDALSLLDQCAAFHFGETLTYDKVLDVLGAVDQSIFARLFDAVNAGDTAASLELLQQMILQGRELTQMVTDFIWYLRNILVAQSAGEGMALEELTDLPAEAQSVLRRQAGEVSQETLMRYIRVMSELSGALRYSAQKRVMTEIALIRLTKPQMEKDPASDTQRLELLEKRLEALEKCPPAAAASAPGEQTAGNSVPAAPEAEETPRQVVLPPAEYEDLMQVRNHWAEMIARMPGSLPSMLRTSTVKPDGEGQMVILLEDETACMYLKRPGHMDDITRTCQEVIGKAIAFSVKLTGNIHQENTIYVTAAELKEKIRMEIQEED